MIYLLYQLFISHSFNLWTYLCWNQRTFTSAVENIFSSTQIKFLYITAMSVNLVCTEKLFSKWPIRAILYISDMPKISIIIFHAFTNKQEISIKVYFGMVYLQWLSGCKFQTVTVRKVSGSTRKFSQNEKKLFLNLIDFYS